MKQDTLQFGIKWFKHVLKQKKAHRRKGFLFNWPLTDFNFSVHKLCQRCAQTRSHGNFQSTMLAFT